MVDLIQQLERKIESTSAWMTSDLRAFYTELRDRLEALHSIEAAARTMLEAFGGNVPDWLQAEAAALESALTDVRAKTGTEKLADALKAFAETGAILDQLGGNCPVQAEGSIDGKWFYFRARGEHWEFHVAATEPDIINNDLFYMDRPYGVGTRFDAGWMDQHEAVAFMVEAVRVYRADRDLRDAYTGQGWNEGTPFAEWVKAMADDNAGTLQSAACLWLLNKGGVTE